MGEVRDGNRLRTCLKIEVNDKNLCQYGWRRALPDIFCFLTSRTANKKKKIYIYIEIHQSFNVACFVDDLNYVPSVKVHILTTDNLNYVLKYNNPFVTKIRLFQRLSLLQSSVLFCSTEDRLCLLI
jgi:hypothetical protein